MTPPSPASAISYTWDDNGNLTDRGSDEFEWGRDSHEDRMVSATVNSVTTTFAYRGDGLRDSRTVGMATTQFTWDIAGGLPVVLDDGPSREGYVYGAGLTAMKQSGNWVGILYYLADGLGSTMAIVDASGNSQKSYEYDVYGEVTGGSGSLGNEFDFAGQQTDGTGLQYLRARYYDPVTGTFLSRDPLVDVPRWAGNGYRYSNSVNSTDPTGLRPEDGGESNWSCTSGCWLWAPGGSFTLADSWLGGGVRLPDGYWFELWTVDGQSPTAYRVCHFVGEYRRCTNDHQATANWWNEQLNRLNAERIKQSLFFALGMINYTTDVEDIFRRLERHHGISRDTASDRLHQIKDNNKLNGQNRDVKFGRNGDVYDADTGEHLGSLTQGGGP